MKVVINVGGLKREFDGSFAICASFQDLTTIRDRLNEAIDVEQPFVYGWIEIYERIKVVPNQKPIGWAE